MKYAIVLLCLCLFQTTLKAETLTAAGDPWPPYLDPDRPGQGLAAQIVREALKREGHELQIRFMPWARALRLVQAGEVDLLVAAWWTEERSAYLYFSKPYATNSVQFIKRKEDAFEFDGLDSLTQKRIGVVRNYGYNDAFYNADNYQRIENADLLVNIRMLLAGRIDLTIEDKLVATTILRNAVPEQLPQIAFAETPLVTKDLHIASGLNHTRHTQIIGAFNRGLAAMQADGSLAELLRQADN